MNLKYPKNSSILFPLPSLAPGLPAAPPASRFRAASASQLGFPGTNSARLAEAMAKIVIWPGNVMVCHGMSWLTHQKNGFKHQKKKLHGLNPRTMGSRVFKMVWPTVDGFNTCQNNINRPPKCRLKLYNQPPKNKKNQLHPVTCFLNASEWTNVRFDNQKWRYYPETSLDTHKIWSSTRSFQIL